MTATTMEPSRASSNLSRREHRYAECRRFPCCLPLPHVKGGRFVLDEKLVRIKIALKMGSFDETENKVR